jgi:molecular chaperone DnaK
VVVPGRWPAGDKTVRADLRNFAELLIRSGLMDQDELRRLLKALPAAERPSTAAALARWLVAENRLTAFQASRLLAGDRRPFVFNNLVILDKLGEGGMGEVYLAEHRRMKRRVAVKVLPMAAVRDEKLLRRFYREVEAAARLMHPNIVTAYDASEYQGMHYLVMEYVDGQDLGTMVDRRGPLPVDYVVGCMIQAARGLHFAHQQGVIHRDIKPSNLLVDRAQVVKILDMGLARLVDSRTGEDTVPDELTGTGHIVGTVDYMSPEQIEGTAQVDHRTDIYSLGCTMYRLLTGVPPFRRSAPIETLIAHRTAPIPRLRDARTDIPPELDQLLERMLAKNPKDRMGSMADVIEGLESCLDHEEFRIAPPRIAVGGTTVRDQVGQEASGERTAVMVDTAVESPGPVRLVPGSSVTGAPLLAVGVDLGTTYSSIAFVDMQGLPVTVANAEGESTTPSMVFWDGDEVVVGREAVKALITDQDYVAAFPKRDLGLPAYHRPIGGVQYPPEVLVAQILSKLVRDASEKIGTFESVVITVPAYFDEVRRKATQDVGYIAGVEVLDIINEPTAAALIYAYQRGWLAGSTTARHLLVYDLGGGTFDVTVMRLADGELRTLATDGDMQLGGLDWDRRLLDYVADEFVQRYGQDPRRDRLTAAQLWRLCDETKRSLSTRRRVTVVVQFAGKQLQLPIERQQFEQLTADLLERTALTTRQTLQSAGLSWKQIDDVLLVGGMTRVPAVQRMIADLWGRQPEVTISPEEAVAQGAALYAQFLLAARQGRPLPIRFVNVNSHSLGVVATDAQTKNRCNAIVIPRNSPLPASATRVFVTQKAGQQSIAINIVEGESSNPDECSPVGRCVVRGLPPNLPRHTAVEVSFRYQENGRLTISVALPGNPAPLEHALTRENTMSAEQLDSWRKIVASRRTVSSH